MWISPFPAFFQEAHSTSRWHVCMCQEGIEKSKNSTGAAKSDGRGESISTRKERGMKTGPSPATAPIHIYMLQRSFGYALQSPWAPPRGVREGERDGEKTLCACVRGLKLETHPLSFQSPALHRGAHCHASGITCCICVLSRASGLIFAGLPSPSSVVHP